MRAKSIFHLYAWLVRTLMSSGKISLEEINRRWELNPLSEEMSLSRPTFIRCKEDIEDIFGIRIRCDRSNGYLYYIDNKDALSDNSIQNWMLSTLSVSQLISESIDLKESIILENIPASSPCLEILTEAIRMRKKVIISYTRYGVSEERQREIEPYCIKLFRMRWYVLANLRKADGDTAMCLFSFDRIKSIQLTEISFAIPKGFSADEYFSEYYGVMTNGNVSLETVIIRAYGNEASYMRDLPIHHSQKEILSNNYFSDFSLYLRPTKDFIAYLAGRGSKITVTSPEWLKEELISAHCNAAAKYMARNRFIAKGNERFLAAGLPMKPHYAFRPSGKRYQQ